MFSFSSLSARKSILSSLMMAGVVLMMLVAVAVPAYAAPFGVESFDGSITADQTGNVSYSQAGGHPYAVSTMIHFNTNPDPVNGALWPSEPMKDLAVDVPPGLVGNPTALAQCSLDQLVGVSENSFHPECPADSQVGVVTLSASGCPEICVPIDPFLPVVFVDQPVYSMVPPPGVLARLAFTIAGTVVNLDVSLRSGTDYGLSLSSKDSPEALPLLGTTVTLWGVPADPSHDPQRWCPGGGVLGPRCPSPAAPTAFLTMPISCKGPPTTAVRVDSWKHPGVFQQASFINHQTPAEGGAPLGVTGCDQVPFHPSFTAKPDVSASSGPSGWSFDLTVPQDDIIDPNAIAEGHLKKATVTLPAGVRVSPSSADGLQACSPAQIALHSTAEQTCPDASKIGTLTIDTPLLADQLTGSVYLAKPHDNPSNSLIAIYLVAKGSGVIVKLPGSVAPDATSGQLTATFDDNPEVSFSHLHLHLFGGPRAPLSNPPNCATYTTTAVMSSWSGKTVESDSSFTTSHDGHGAPCPSARFNPSFSAGIQNPAAGAFTPFVLQLQRADDDGEFNSLSSLSLPPGLLADVASVSTRCTDAQATAAACPAASHIGEVTVGAGAGSNPFYVGGDVYLTGPYKGSPFGIAVIVHAVAGPFDLGYVVVKGAIQIHDDGSVTVATDPFPTILQGIPLQVKDIRVNLDRPGFMFNPTSCSPMSINGTVLSTANQQAGVSSRFQVGECANLAFKPSFTVSTAGKTSKANGASLRVHIGTHEGPGSTGATRESNIAKVDVQLPVVLPARLPTLQKACTAAQFAADPAGCPVGSFVGTAIAHTPILASPLSGPAILVSHGGQAFPDLVLVLQGEGVRINLTGHTQIKKGITYNHFETVPDAPVSSFDLTLPAGPHGVLTTDVPGRNLCATTRTVTVTKRVTRRVHGHNRRVMVKAKKAVAASLLMPTTMTAQNGAVIHQNTKIAVTGCAKGKVVKHRTKGKGAKRGG